MIYDREPWRRVAKVLFGCYVLLMLWLLFIHSRSAGREGMRYWEQVKISFNIIPFRTLSRYLHILASKEYYMAIWGAYSIYRFYARHAVINLVGNVVMFVPLGFFLPVIWQSLRRLRFCMLCGASIILCIEIVQLFTLTGSCDIDDLLLNLIGIGLGYVLFLFGKCFDTKKRCQ